MLNTLPGYCHFETNYAAVLCLFLVQWVLGVLEIFVVEEMHRNSMA